MGMRVLIVAVLLLTQLPVAAARSSVRDGPHPLYAAHSEASPGERLVAWLYTPATLAALRQSRPSDLLAMRFDRERCAVIVFREIAAVSAMEAAHGSYRASIGLPNSSAFSAANRSPIWTETDAELLDALRSSLGHRDIAFIAAFNEEDLVPGHRVYLWRETIYSNPVRPVIQSVSSIIPRP
jgi:hypothetical protein